MRMEFTYANFNYLLCLNAIKTFLDNVPSYTLVQGVVTVFDDGISIPRFNKYTYVTFKENIRNIYVTFFNCGDSDYVSMLVSTSFDVSKAPWMNDGIIWNNTTFFNRTDFSSTGTSEQTCNYFQYAPVPSLYKVNKLVCNYDSSNDNIMISGIRYYEVSYAHFVDTHSETHSIYFGEVVKFLEYTGGFFYGGDYYTSLEILHRVRNNYNSSDYNYYYSRANIVGSGVSTDYDGHIVKRKVGSTWRYTWADSIDSGISNRDGLPQFNLLISVDNAEGRDIRKLSRIVNARANQILDNSNGDIKLSDTDIDVEIRNIWAVTLAIPYYMNMHTTYEVVYQRLPTFWTETTHSQLDVGHTVGTLSKISLLMPIHFYVRRDPLEEELYSQAGEIKGIKYVNMLHMSTNKIKKNSFPVPSDKYNCFNCGSRRNKYGYNGIAIRVDDEVTDILT